jgi:hypothetical protein
MMKQLEITININQKIRRVERRVNRKRPNHGSVGLVCRREEA